MVWRFDMRPVLALLQCFTLYDNIILSGRIHNITFHFMTVDITWRATGHTPTSDINAGCHSFTSDTTHSPMWHCDIVTPHTRPCDIVTFYYLTYFLYAMSQWIYSLWHNIQNAGVATVDKSVAFSTVQCNGQSRWQYINFKWWMQNRNVKIFMSQL